MSRKPNRVDDLVDRLYQEGAATRIEAELARLRDEALSRDELESWHHSWGIAAIQRGDQRGALARFEEGLREFHESALLRFSVGQEQVLLGNAESGFREFDRCLFPSVPRAYALAAARYAYLWDQLDRGWRYVEVFLPHYYTFGIADDHYVYVRGLPFFGQAWAYLAAFAVLGKRLPILFSITGDAERRLRDFEFSELKVQLRAYETGDVRPWLASVLERGREAEAEGRPSGYLAMQAAVLAAGLESDSAEARRRIEEVRLTERDFGWLADIRLIARCELAARAGDPEGEGRLKADFLRRQPLLFEPTTRSTSTFLPIRRSSSPSPERGLRDGRVADHTAAADRSAPRGSPLGRSLLGRRRRL